MDRGRAFAVLVGMDASLLQQVRTARQALDREAGAVRATAQRGKAVQAEIVSLATEVEQLEKAAAVLNVIGSERQTSTQAHIEGLVTHGLQTIFGPELSFHLVTTEARKTTTTDFVLRSVVDGQEVETPVMDARGGGVAATVGFLLRVVMLLLGPERQMPVLVLDETFAQLSEDYEPRMAEFLRELVDRTPLQVIMVTHSTAYTDAADIVYRLSLDGGVTKMESLSA